jgi:hypothetical protein
MEGSGCGLIWDATLECQEGLKKTTNNIRVVDVLVEIRMDISRIGEKRYRLNQCDRYVWFSTVSLLSASSACWGPAVAVGGSGTTYRAIFFTAERWASVAPRRWATRKPIIDLFAPRLPLPSLSSSDPWRENGSTEIRTAPSAFLIHWMTRYRQRRQGNWFMRQHFWFRKVLSSTLVHGTDYPSRGFSWSYSAPLGKCRDGASNKPTAATFHFFANSLFTMYTHQTLYSLNYCVVKYTI